jgi:hypothetical protein
MASRILKANGDTRPLGKRWVPHFIKRHPEIASIIGKKIKALRVQSTTREAIQEFFDRFEAITKEFGIRIKNTWNINEQGLGLGVYENSKVLGSSKKKHTYVTTPENREWVSILECGSAGGRKIDPLVIFKG